MSKVPSSAPKSADRSLFGRHWGLKLALLLLLFYTFSFYQRQGSIGMQAKPLTGETLNGAKSSLENFRGRPAVIYFWASWCEVCRSMSDNITAVARDNPVVTVASLSGTSEQVARYVRTNGFSVPVVVDPQGRLAASYGVTVFPTIIVLDKRGKILLTEVGYTTEIGLRARLWIARQIGRAADKWF